MEDFTMNKMGLNEIRQRFLDFFESKGHLVEASYPLVPQKDKSLLLINAGMAPMKNFFSGVETPPSKRMATCQKCIRTIDIDNVGHTSRHATMFEMLGNFSFGDYFKRETLNWGWEFITDVLELPLDNLWVTVYLTDDEAYDIWKNEIGVPEDRIVRLGKEDNFWEVGVGPCGPCSEIYYDRGEKFGCGSEDCKPGCECDRFVEFWNHVFTQFERDEAGEYHDLANPNIDTGMGLERIACLMQGVDSIFEIDTLKHILDKVVEASGVAYGKDEKSDISIRIITDHTRAVSFLVADGVMPNNEGRGYVLRRLLRRAARHGKLLGIKGNFITKLVDEVIHVSGEAYPELVEKKDYIKKIISIEEDRFQQTLDHGLEVLNAYLVELKENNTNVFSGKKAFELYDTYGFPLELTQEIADEKGYSLNADEFTAEMEDQKTRARAARASSGGVAWEDSVLTDIEADIKTTFRGYDSLNGTGEVVAMVKDNEIVGHVTEGSEAHIILNETTFYAEGGGQVGDKGLLVAAGVVFEVSETKKGANDSIIHIGTVKSGTINTGDILETKVDRVARKGTERNHTCTHILHKVLKTVVGDHVAQAGSLVNEGRLRFDFSHFEGIEQKQIAEIEKMVNDKIFEEIDVLAEVMSIDQAKEKGATALFGEKYGSEVRVVTAGEFSMELCGGCHVNNTGSISAFKILSETGIAAGVRRIEAITGSAVLKYLNELESKVNGVAGALKANTNDVLTKAEALMKDLKAAQKENEKLKDEIASKGMDDFADKAENVNGIDLIAVRMDGIDANSLRNLADKLKDTLDTGLVVLASAVDGKVALVAMATKSAVEKGVHAGNVIKEVAKITGGGGGGRPNMAQAGGKNAEKIDEALVKVKDILTSL